MIRPRNTLIIIGILTMVLSIIPLLSVTDISISGFNIADEVGDSKLPETTTPYFLAIFTLALIAVIFGCRSRNIIIH